MTAGLGARRSALGRATTVLELRKRLDAITEAPQGEVRAIATGIAALDGALARGGIPCGRLTALVGARGGGKTTLLRQVVDAAIARGLWVAYVDAARTLAPRDWARTARAGDGTALWMVRPARAARGAWCAELLLRSGAFALVVLDGAPPLADAVAVRLARLARESGVALVVAAEDDRAAAALGGALRLRVARRARRVEVTVEKGGRRTTVEVWHGRSGAVADRVRAHPEVPDRRGVARPRAAGDGERGAAARAAAVAARAGRPRARPAHAPAAAVG